MVTPSKIVVVFTAALAAANATGSGVTLTIVGVADNDGATEAVADNDGVTEAVAVCDRVSEGELDKEGVWDLVGVAETDTDAVGDAVTGAITRMRLFP